MDRRSKCKGPHCRQGARQSDDGEDESAATPDPQESECNQRDAEWPISFGVHIVCKDTRVFRELVTSPKGAFGVPVQSPAMRKLLVD